MPGHARRSDSWSRQLLRLGLVVLLPLAIFAAHGAQFSAWEIDDAGISYSYARNLVTGKGLVAQPGTEPVEGFTNLLWVVLLAALLPVLDSPGQAARALSYGFVLASFLILALGARSWFPQRWQTVTALGLSASALVTGFPAWTLSGLENGLYACLVAAFVVATALAPDSAGAGAAVGGLWILLIATRPDAAPFVVVPAVAWAARRADKSLWPFAMTAAAGLFALTAFRTLYFGDVLPNTYYAKSAPGWRLLAGVAWTPTTGLLFGLTGALALLAVIRVTWLLAGRVPRLQGRSPRQVGFLTLWLTLLLAYLIFETLPGDWMPEGRFATILFLLGPLGLLGLVRRRKVLLGAAAAVLLVATAGYSLGHTRDFVKSPPAPFGSVLQLSDQLAALGDALGTGRATTVLLPDIGGALWRNEFVVVDLGGLIDRRIARTLRAEDRGRFLDHVFELRKPDVIWSHGYWRTFADLESDPRLARDYRLLSDDGMHALYLRSALVRGLESDRLLEAFAAPGAHTAAGS